ncbi:MAG: RluA family pseudouridine synthase [Pseudomonadota bacterium]|nr:RluA family pseudouridine synthase [Pseudomonadota bacterium]
MKSSNYREAATVEETAPGDDTEPEVRRQTVDPEAHGERLDKLLVTMAPEFSRSHLQQLLACGQVLLDGAVAITASRRVRVLQQVQLTLLPTEESLAFRPQAMALSVLYEDEHLLVIDKPAGLVVHPAAGNWSGTLLNGLLARHADAARLPRAGIVHRLDKDTSGVMMVGRSLAAVTALTRDIAARAVQRRYVALAHGTVAPVHFSIDEPIGRDPRVRVRMAVVAGGRASRTDVQVLDSSDGISALGCTLHSGRTHQIRVHLASIGHPLVADAVYGGRPALGMQRQALHAQALELSHPISRAPLAFEAPMPDDLRMAWVLVSKA